MSSSYLNPSHDIPEDITPPEMWPEFGHIARPAALCSREAVGQEPVGIRWSFWPFTFEEYFSDREPDIEKSRYGELARIRQVMWNRVHSRGPVPGWKEESQSGWRIDAFFRLGQDTNYTQAWSQDAQRNLAQWQKKFLHASYDIESLEWGEFVKAYRKSVVAKKFGLELLHTLERRLLVPEASPYITLYGVRNIKTREIIAGTAVLFSPTHSASVQECRFMLPEGRAVHAPTALFDHWFSVSQDQQLTKLHITHFWQKGDNPSWKGFSDFKSHFGFTHIEYPPGLSRWVRGKLY